MATGKSRATLILLLAMGLPYGLSTPWLSQDTSFSVGSFDSKTLHTRQTTPPPTSSQIDPLDDAPDFSKDPHPPYPPFHRLDGSNFTAENVRGTRLFGWKGCGTNEINIITETWNDFHTLASQKSLYENIDWSSQAAREIWGPKAASFTDETKNQIKQIYQQLEQMWDPWWWPPYDKYVDRPGFGWTNLWIRVRCAPDGDSSNMCGDAKCADGSPPARADNDPEVEAYSDPKESYSQITFCNYFFNKMKSLKEVMDAARAGTPADRNDLWKYQNRARVIFHEMTHMVRITCLVFATCCLIGSESVLTANAS